ncbi:MAG: hypothetical protein JO020_08585 [Chloroflexi bacterium]|nr:hypothetical protein [Chloroflexota bacterium]
MPWRWGIWLLAGLAAALALQVLAHLLAPPVGLKASYWAAATPQAPPERSTDFRWLADATRIEPALDLHGEDFGVHFFNDATRFNFGADVVPGRDQLPFSMRWDGWLIAPTAGPRHFVVDATGPATVWLDGQSLGANDSTVDLSAGQHQLRVEYSRPEARVPSLRVRWQRYPGGALETVGGDDVRWREDAGPLPLLSTAFGALGLAALAAVAVALLVLLRRGRRLAWWPAGLLLLPLAFAAYGTLLEAPMAGKATILSGLDDWLIYESSARDILLNGPLMDGGQGHAAPFYGQPLYPYALAIAHWLTGESLFGPIVVQFAALGAVAAGTAVLARRCFGQVLDGVVALAFFLVLLQVEPEHFKIARQLFNENLYMPLVMASLVVVVGLARGTRPPPWWQALLTGMLLGVTAISRSQFLLFVPFALAILFAAWRHAARLTALGRLPLLASKLTVLVGIGVVLVIVPVTARNWIVSGQFVPISSSGGASLLEFHRPPAGLIDQAALQQNAAYNALHLDTSTRTVVEFARKDPAGYLGTLLPLGAHSIGLQGRNDPGVSWPLLLTCALYVGSLAFKRTRRLHVWPVHAFVGTHLLVLMLFEADTYGYRLVMPMYAPMAAVAGQVPLELVQRLLRSRFGSAIRSGEQQRAARFALAGWSAIGLLAMLWQVGSLVPIWPDREAALHGLGGAAAHAVETADRVSAESIYVASVDGTPRHFGAGNLPGLRYPWIKWFDPLRSLPLPPASTTAVYVLSELRGVPDRTGNLTDCLGPPDAFAEIVAGADQVRAACTASLIQASSLGATFDGLARIDALSAPASAAAGEPLETRLVWQPLVAHPEPRQVSVQLDDPASGDGSLWGNGTVELYPAAQWQTDETVLSRIPVSTDATALPQTYRLTVGMSPVKPNAGPDLATWQGTRTDRVPVASVALTPGLLTADMPLPNDMRPVEGPPLMGGGLELVAARPLPAEAAVGGPLRLGLLWRATQDSPSVTQVRLRLVDSRGSVLQESALPLLGGRAAPGTLREGNVVRDEQSFVVSAALSGQNVALELSLEDQWQRLGSLNLTGRAHVMDTSRAPAIASFGGAMELLSFGIDPASVKAGDKVNVNLRWRAAAPMSVGYKVFVHVLDVSGSSVLAQRDSEPLGGAAPTTSWLTGEDLDDAYPLVLPKALAPGEYPVEVGVYDPRSGDRLTLGDGANHLVLSTRLTVR